MNPLIIYNSQTGFTKRYAEWLAERINGTLLSLKEAKKQSAGYFNDFETILFGSWAMAGNLAEGKWFYENATSWQNKQLVIFCVGANPTESPEAEKLMEDLLTEEQRGYIQAFYLQGGLDYSKMKTGSKLMMKMFTSMLKKKKDATPSEKDMAARIDHSYDISDKKYIEPIVELVCP